MCQRAKRIYTTWSPQPGRNHFSVTSPYQGIFIKYSIGNSISDLIPNIDGRWTIETRSKRHHFTGDAYPSNEFFFKSPAGQVQSLRQLPARDNDAKYLGGGMELQQVPLLWPNHLR